MRGQVSIVRSRQLSNFSKSQLRRYLRDNPTWDDDPYYKALWKEGFIFQGTKIVNPFWTICCRFEVDPVEEYGMAFLSLPLAARMGYTAPVIEFPAHILSPKARVSYEKSLISRVMNQKAETHLSAR